MTISDTEVLRVSHSQLLRWYNCKAAWKFNYVDRYVPKEQAKYFQAGTLTHELLAIYYEGMRDGVRDPWKNILEYARNNTPTEGADLNVFKRVLRVVQRYVSQYAPKNDRFRILDVEHHFTVLLNTPKGRPFELEGYIDLLVELDGRMWLWDHKSTASKFWTDTQVVMDAQMPLYAMALRHVGYDIFGIIINQINTYDYAKFDEVPNNKLFKRNRTYRTDKELDSILVSVGQAVDEMYEEEVYRKSLRKECASCPYQQPCLMELKGLDPDPVWDASYKKYVRRGEQEDEFDTELSDW